MIVDPTNVVEDRHIALASLHTFMRLPVVQRSSVILMDVLGYTLQEIGEVMDSRVPAVKSALHRGRSRLRELAKEPDDQTVPVLAEPERSRLAAYVERFNARDFDAIRDMLADEVRLDLGDPSGVPAYFILLEWTGDNVLTIRDFRYARYVMLDAEPVV